MAFRSRGLPSRGCNKCRAKKIRCDETKPICQNCIRVAYTECKYRDEFERTWRVHTEKTIEKTAERPDKQLSSPGCPVLARFFFDWTSGVGATPGVSISWLDALPTMYANAEERSLLHNSIQALAHVNHGKRCGSAESVEKGAEYYGEALRNMRHVISSDHDQPMRDILASAVLLGIHEAFVDPSMSTSGSWLSHICGASVFVNKQVVSRTASQSPLDLQIRSMVFRQTLHGSFLSGRSPTISLDQDRTLEDPKLKPLHEHNSLLYQSTMLCSEWRAVFRGIDNPDGLERLASIAGRAVLLDEKLEQWAQTLPRPFGYTMKPLKVPETAPDWIRNLLISDGAPRFWHEPASPVSEMLWRFYWETRMIICQALLYTNSVLSSMDSPINPISGREDDVESCLLNSVDRLCESCVTPLIKTFEKANGGALKAEEIPSIRGYLMLQILPTIHLCLEQTMLRNEQVDLGGRRTWIKAMKDFVQFSLGFTKAAAEIDPTRLQNLPVQLWNLGDESCWSMGRRYQDCQ